ncbi:MAG: XRE family transcriptional regulator [Halobacteriovorax sp.]|nr:XRE family transcriptional regulator [Halobacteriovorax sp.]|tara:strand:+ start:285 stop:560 length:276 start_codon:yes stop_codon:yes gene_type:complete
MSMNPYDIDIKKLKLSKRITDPKEILKCQIAAKIIDISVNIGTDKTQELTGLHKADLSRVRVMDLKRFTIDRLIGIATDLGLEVSIKIKSA